MRKLFTLAAFSFSLLAFAQETPPQSESTAKTSAHTLYGSAMFSEPSQFGLYYEYEGKGDNADRSSTIVNLSYGTMNYEIEGTDLDVNGSGFAIELGSRNYFKKSAALQGFYTANYLSYGNIKFDKTVSGTKFDGTYRYFSFFTPEVGYKIKAGNLCIDPFIGIMWKIEVKGKGDIDNRITDEWVPRAGLRVGYSF